LLEAGDAVSDYDDGPAPIKIPRKLENEWRSRLAQSGFQDLEGPTRDAPLSDRGNLHESGDENEIPLPERMVHGEAYIDWARHILQKLNEHSAEGRLKRRLWERHANGESLKEIGRTEPGVNFYRAREIIQQIKEKYGCDREPTSGAQIRAYQRKSVRTVESTAALIQLATAMMVTELRARIPKRSRTKTRTRY
jgi:hypothetical protein